MVSKQPVYKSVWFRRVAGALLLVFVFGLGAFLNNQSNNYSTSSWSGGSAYDYDMPSMESEGQSVKSMMSDSYDDESYAMPTTAGSDLFEEGVETKIIKTASLTLTVKSTTEAIASLNALATARGGFVQSSSTWLQADETTAGSVTLRVSVDQFEEAMTDVRNLATVVENESISGQDVTEEYVDLQSRLNALQAEEARYLSILEQAKTVEDLLMTSDYLSAVRVEIELIQGRMKYFDNQTDFSTISVSIYEEASLVIPTSDWQPVVTMKQAFNHLIVFLQGLIELFIWIVVFGIPTWIVYLIVRGAWKWKQRKQHR